MSGPARGRGGPTLREALLEWLAFAGELGVDALPRPAGFERAAAGVLPSAPVAAGRTAPSRGVSVAGPAAGWGAGSGARSETHGLPAAAGPGAPPSSNAPADAGASAESPLQALRRSLHPRAASGIQPAVTPDAPPAPPAAAGGSEASAETAGSRRAPVGDDEPPPIEAYGDDEIAWTGGGMDESEGRGRFAGASRSRERPATAERPARGTTAAGAGASRPPARTPSVPPPPLEAGAMEVRRLGVVPDELLRIAMDPGGPAARTLDDVQRALGDCRRCRLHEGRTKIVFGSGNPQAELMFVGEGPGREEDLQGLPFVGRAGQLLSDIIKAIGLERDQVYIANVVKCRPPENRTPEPDEAAACSGFLYRQIAVIRPKVVVALGKPATETLLRMPVAISAVRGRVFDLFGAKLVPTFHPAYLLRSPNRKREVWEDMKKVRDLLLGKAVEG